ncbi:putative bifunctional diguanylate cyclase/phosphodiesterase [Paractinoplanes toevensis]|uniref:putative bifunctional diguanylate cyclase/phosphodiesterase n=1 Tax=Paractinoplanes toevensis TaxID=571911 RepID=UPI001FE80129|nr:bifunctional diguanylate cyclase/phosphodiesterase [Actinoplanes toevensis]
MRLWRGWVAIGLLATAGYYLVPADTFASNLVYNAIGLTSGLLILVALRLYRPARPAMWYLFSAGQILSVVGDLTWEYYEYVRHEEPYPSFADLFYVCSYLPLIAGLLLLMRRRRGNAGGVLDAAMVATGLGLALWVFVLHPIAAAGSASTLERFISTAYPALDAMLLAMLALLFVEPDARTPSTNMLGLAAVLLLISDVAFSVATLYWSYDGHALDGGWLMSYVLWAAAALHPSMAVPPAAVKIDTVRRVSRRRLAVLGACSVLAPGLLFVPGIGADGVDRLVIGAAAVALFLLGLARMAGFAHKIHGLAMHDDLTGLSNRRHLYQVLDEALARGEAEVALLGLTNFKAINDEVGHRVGDHLLVRFADRLRVAAGPGAVVARTDGDEFAVLLPDLDAGHRLAATVHDPIRVDDYELLLGAAVGLSDGVGATDPAEVLRRAGVAMYAAKQTGEPFRRWSPALDERTSQYARLGAQLRAGLDGGQFRVVYQPIVAVPSRRVVAVEALVRWEHPVRGPISPAEFIPVAEQNGLIFELGEWILATACRQLAEWRTELGDLAPDRVSVNASARQLARPGFANTVAQALAAARLPADCLTIEMTETAVFQGGQAISTLHELRALGVRIALDDFGTGHSSLGLLQTVPVDILKVDKSFVDNITETGRHTVIARSLIQISEGLGLTAVAEGVETAEQADVLEGLGYRLLQGYYFGKPSSRPDLAAREAPFV